MGRVVVVGSFNVDHVWRSPRLPRPGETLAGEYSSGPGGKGFNQAVAARRAGAETLFLCALGDDPGGALARSLAAQDGIELRAASSLAPTGTAGIYVDADGRNSIVIGAGANADLGRSFIDAQAGVLGTAAVVLAQLESPMESVQHALQAGRAGGALTILNPAPANAPCPAGLLAASDVVTPNETEFSALLSSVDGVRADPADVASMDDAGLHRLCRKLMPHGTVVITLGAAGAFVSHAGEVLRGDAAEYQRAPAEAVRPTDTTGAGDAFNGALAAGLAMAPRAPFMDHVRYAIRVAGLATERPGAAASMPWRREVLERFNRPGAAAPGGPGGQ